jgi:hypothetical protein
MGTGFADSLTDIENCLEIANVENWEFEFEVAKVTRAVREFQTARGAGACFVADALLKWYAQESGDKRRRFAGGGGGMEKGQWGKIFGCVCHAGDFAAEK